MALLGTVFAILAILTWTVVWSRPFYEIDDFGRCPGGRPGLDWPYSTVGGGVREKRGDTGGKSRATSGVRTIGW